MVVQHDISLPGCTPEPLMSYLKALGVLRLVSEQKDGGARGWWRHDSFWLRSSLDEDTLVEFFLNEYEPTPILAPWNAGSGFYKKWDQKKGAFKSREAVDAVDAMACSTTSQLSPYRAQLLAVRKALVQLSAPVNVSAKLRSLARDETKEYLKNTIFLDSETGVRELPRASKDDFLSAIRSEVITDEGLRWLDAALVLHTGRKKNRAEAPLLGSGGNIGNSEFSIRFVQMLRLVLPFERGEASPERAANRLRRALFATPVVRLEAVSVDQFLPGCAGGANMGQSLEATPQLNPWDYILMVEGALLFAGTAARRLATDASAPAFPFTVDAIEEGCSCVPDGKTRAEMWLPIWRKRASATEASAILTEGRAQLGRRGARDGLDFARAVASLGVDRGVESFVRYQFQKRFGDNYLATALERMDVRHRSEVDLLRQIDPWLDAFRRGAGEKNAPPRFRSALRGIDQAVLDLCRYGGGRHLQSVLMALGRAERQLSLTPGKIGYSKTAVRPLVGLSAEWITHVDDRTREFAIARALAAMRDDEFKVGPLRTNLEAAVVSRAQSGEWYANWAEKDRAVVWNAADLATNLTGVLQRRVMDGARVGCERLPLDSLFAVPLHMVSAFIAGDIEDERIEDLIWGLMLINDQGSHGYTRARRDSSMVPRAYALLKLLFLPRPLIIEHRGDRGPFARLVRDREPGGIVIRPEPSILHLLRGGRLGEACAIAMRRLRASGLDPMPGPIRSLGVRDREWLELDQMGGAGVDPRRLAAALLIPIRDDSVRRLARLVLRGGEIDDDKTENGSALSFEGDMLS